VEVESRYLDTCSPYIVSPLVPRHGSMGQEHHLRDVLGYN
ncbi:hypothetical protein Tco_0982901, partial [Tanacetum coccineum]